MSLQLSLNSFVEFYPIKNTRSTYSRGFLKFNFPVVRWWNRIYVMMNDSSHPAVTYYYYFVLHLNHSRLVIISGRRNHFSFLLRVLSRWCPFKGKDRRHLFFRCGVPRDNSLRGGGDGAHFATWTIFQTLLSRVEAPRESITRRKTRVKVFFFFFLVSPLFASSADCGHLKEKRSGYRATATQSSRLSFLLGNGWIIMTCCYFLYKYLQIYYSLSVCIIVLKAKLRMFFVFVLAGSNNIK